MILAHWPHYVKTWRTVSIQRLRYVTRFNKSMIETNDWSMIEASLMSVTLLWQTFRALAYNIHCNFVIAQKKMIDWLIAVVFCNSTLVEWSECGCYSCIRPKQIELSRLHGNMTSRCLGSTLTSDGYLFVANCRSPACCDNDRYIRGSFSSSPADLARIFHRPRDVLDFVATSRPPPTSTYGHT